MWRYVLVDRFFWSGLVDARRLWAGPVLCYVAVNWFVWDVSVAELVLCYFEVRLLEVSDCLVKFVVCRS